MPAIGPTPSSTFYLLALAAAIGDAADRLVRSTASKLGAGLFAIHDDEDAAEVMGVPTYRYKLVALGDLVRAGRRGRRHPRAVRLVRDGGRGVHDHRAADRGADERARRHAPLGRAGGRRGAITALLYAFTAADHAVAGKAVIGAILIAAILFMPDGILRPACGAPARAVPAARQRAGAVAAPVAEPPSARRDAPAPTRDRRAAAARRAACASRSRGVQRARRRRPRRAARRDPRPARAERLGQVDVHQRRQRPLRADRRRASCSKAATSPACPRTASRAPASRAPTRSRGRSRT